MQSFAALAAGAVLLLLLMALPEVRLGTRNRRIRGYVILGALLFAIVMAVVIRFVFRGVPGPLPTL